MTILHDEGTFYAECDASAYVEELYAETFEQAVEEMKDKGWTFTQIDGEWKHFCPDLKPEDAEWLSS